MRKALIPAFLLVLASLVLGATLFREPVAWAAQTVSATIVGPLDSNGNVAVHEQGTASTRDITEQSAINAETRFTMNAGQQIDSFEVYRVPAGKRLVIEEADGQCVTFGTSVDGIRVSAWIGAGAAGQGSYHWLPMTSQVSGPDQDQAGGGGPVRIYADPNATVHGAIFRSASSTTNALCIVSLSGRLIDMP